MKLTVAAATVNPPQKYLNAPDFASQCMARGTIMLQADGCSWLCRCAYFMLHQKYPRKTTYIDAIKYAAWLLIFLRGTHLSLFVQGRPAKLKPVVTVK